MFRTAACLVGLATPFASPLAAQDISACDPIPSLTDLVEPWEDAVADPADGWLRLAVLWADAGTVDLAVLATRPRTETVTPEDEAASPVEPLPGRGRPLPPVQRDCFVIRDTGAGFAAILASDAVGEGTDGNWRVTVPVLRYVPESSELEQRVLILDWAQLSRELTATLEPSAESADGSGDASASADPTVSAP